MLWFLRFFDLGWTKTRFASKITSNPLLYFLWTYSTPLPSHPHVLLPTLSRSPSYHLRPLYRFSLELVIVE